jgi:hypothetical protein
MKTLMVFIAGGMFLSTALASDPGFEERYRMKNGRNTPAEETRQGAARIAAAELRTNHVMSCADGCCNDARQKAVVAKSEVAMGDPGAEERYRMKFGRNSPARERSVAAAKRATTESVLLVTASLCEAECCKQGQ